MSEELCVSCLTSIWHWLHAAGEWLWAIDPTVKAALIAVAGGGLALIGNRIEKQRQEFLELRREIYLAAADAFSSVITYLGLMSDPAVSQASGREAFDALGKVIAKIHLVAEKPVIEATTDLQRLLMRRHLALREDKSAADELVRRLNENFGIIQRAVQLLQSSPPNQAVIFARVQELQQENQRIHEELVVVRWRLIDGWLDLQPKLAEPISDGVAAVKKELGIDIDRDWYSSWNCGNMRADANELREHLARFRPENQAAPASDT